MTVVFPIALQHFISSTYHLTMCSLVAHNRIIKLKMEGIVADCCSLITQSVCQRQEAGHINSILLLS